MGSSTSGDTQTTVRYASYIEDKHKSFLEMAASTRIELIGSSGTQAMTYDEWMADNYPLVPKQRPVWVDDPDDPFQGP